MLNSAFMKREDANVTRVCRGFCPRSLRSRLIVRQRQRQRVKVALVPRQRLHLQRLLLALALAQVRLLRLPVGGGVTAHVSDGGGRFVRRPVVHVLVPLHERLLPGPESKDQDGYGGRFPGSGFNGAANHQALKHS